MKIEKSSREGTTTIRLIGAFQSEHLSELKEQFGIASYTAKVICDLKEVTFLDLDVVRFLASLKARGMELVNCPLYIRDWIRREQTGKR